MSANIMECSRTAPMTRASPSTKDSGRGSGVIFQEEKAGAVMSTGGRGRWRHAEKKSRKELSSLSISGKAKFL